MPKQNSEKQLIQVPMGAGMDESAPASILVPGKLESCINGAISRTGSVEPRNGFSAMPTVDIYGNTVTYKDVCFVGDGASQSRNCVAFDDHNIYTFSEERQGWNAVDHAPEAQLARVDLGERGIQDPSYTQPQGCDSVEIGDFRFHAWAERHDALYTMRWRVVDTTAAAECRFSATSEFTSAPPRPRLLKHYTKAYLVYQDTPGSIVARIFDTANPAAGWSAATTIVADLDLNYPVWEACIVYATPVPQKFYIAYNLLNMIGAPHIRVKQYDLALTAANNVDLRAGACTGIGINGAPSADLIYVAYDENAGTGITCDGISISTWIQSWGPTVVDAVDIYTAASESRLERIGIAVHPATHTARIVYSLWAHITLGGGHWNPVLRYRDMSSAGVAGSFFRTWLMSMRGQPFFRENGNYCYVPVVLAQTPWHQYTFSVSSAIPPVPNNQPLPHIQNNAFLLRISFVQSRVVIRLCPYLVGDWNTVIPYPGVRPVNVDTKDGVSYSMALSKLADGSIDTDVGFDIYRFTFGVQGDKRPVSAGAVSIFSGGIPTQWDGDRLTEIGWNYYPRIGNVVSGSGPGFLVHNAQYFYAAMYVWEDAQGQKHYSAPSLPMAYVQDLIGFDSAAVEVDCLTLTDRQDNEESRRPVVIELYRTLAAPSQDYHFVGRMKNDPSSPSVTFQDTLADATIETRKMIPTRGGVLPAGCLGAVRQFEVHNGRPWALLAEDPSQLAFGHFALPGEAPRFPDGWTLRCSRGSSYTAIGSIGDKLLAWQRHAIDAIYGNGPNDAGQGGNYSDPQRIVGTVGCSNHNALVRYPDGYLFLAESGWWTIDEGFKVDYRGAAVESSNDTYPVVQAAFLDDSQYRVVILCNNTTGTEGVGLVWYYPWNMWTRWEIPSSTDVALDPMVGGCVAYRAGIRSIYLCTASGKIEREQSICRDHSASWVPMNITTGWISPVGLQGFGHTWNINVLGTYRDPHTFRAAVYYNYDVGQVSPHNWTAAGVAAALSGTRLQLSIQPQWPEAQAIQISLALQANPATATTGKCSRLEALTLEAASEPGLGVLRAEAKR